jgi:hypothetical protein
MRASPATADERSTRQAARGGRRLDQLLINDGQKSVVTIRMSPVRRPNPLGPDRIRLRTSRFRLVSTRIRLCTSRLQRPSTRIRLAGRHTRDARKRNRVSGTTKSRTEAAFCGSRAGMAGSSCERHALETVRLRVSKARGGVAEVVV